MASDKELYFTLMRETEKAIRILIAAQQKCERLYMENKETEIIPFVLPKGSSGNNISE